MRKPKTSSKTKVFSEITNKTTVDNRLTQAALLLNYAFDYGVDFKNRVIEITGEIDEIQFDRLDTAMTEMESESKKTITIKINSPGGSTYQALAMVGRIKESKCHIVTKGYGHVMSAATLILACGDKRYMSRFGFFMHHECSYEIGGRHSEIKADVMQVENEEKLWCQWMGEFTAESQSFWKKHGVGKNAYFTAEELLSLGVIDELF